MAITRYNPWQDVEQPAIPRRFSSVLDDFFNDVVASDTGRMFVPSLDVSEDQSHYHVHVTLPGMKKDDINVDLQGRRLTISGERKEEKEEKETKYHLTETRYGTFERSVMLPENINENKIDARFEDGVLKLDIEKKEKQVNKQIKIK